MKVFELGFGMAYGGMGYFVFGHVTFVVGEGV